MTEEINVTFIIPKECDSENDCPEEMKVAFSACTQYSDGGLIVKWVHENNCSKFDELTKKDVLVISDFYGALYEKLKNTKCLLVGPRCLSCSLIEGTPIPRGPEPVFTIAMRGLMVTASGFTKTKKENIKQKVHWMGGLYISVLTEETTHLVSDTVISDKYIKAVEKGIPVMHESWIEAVWLASLEMNVNGSSSDFDVHHLPPFTNLQITTTGITKKEKQMIIKLVNENGGVFSGAFQSETTDVVVLTKDGVGSEKYKAALEYGKSCVSPTWVKDSAKKGVALPFAKYKVVGASTSSPFAEHRLPDMSLNFSRITNIKARSNFVDESRSVDVSTLSAKMKLSQESKRSNETLTIDKGILKEFEQFDIRCVRKAGPIFDGFCIWVSGLEGIARERAAACVSRCGGVRYDGPNERVTHAVAGTAAAAASAARLLPEVPVLNAIWLLKSAEAGRALPENDFLMDKELATPVKQNSHKHHVEPASPMSKRNLQLLRHATLDLPPPAPVNDLPDLPEHQDELVNHYLSQNIPEPIKEKTPEPVAPNATTAPEQPEITDMCEDPSEDIEQIFRDIKIEVQGLDEEAICELGAEVSAAGGVLMAAGAGGAYTLVPLDFDPNELTTSTAQAVTVFWVKDCLSQQELLPVQYYHQPVRVPQWDEGCAPLRGVVASLSTYSGIERAFLDELAKLLGATTQLRFCRRSTASALASTHLICPSPCGDKYAGAIKWRLPAVRASWLLASAAAGRRVSEKQHLVGDSEAPPTPEQSPTKEKKNAEELITNQTAFSTDKENSMHPPQRCEVPSGVSFSNKEDTPKVKLNDGEDMSPASRYIAMARQGLLGGDSQETPKRLQELKDEALPAADAVRTPPLDDALSSPNLAALSPTTRRRLRAVRRGEMPSDPIRTPVDPFEKNPETPDSAFGAALRPGSGRLSPDSRKRLWKVVNDLPAKEQHQPVRDQHTPLSEIRNRFLAQFNSDAPTPPSAHVVAPRKLQLQDQSETPPTKMAKLSLDRNVVIANSVDTDGGAKTDSSASSASKSANISAAVDAQLQRLSEALSNRLSSQRAKRSRESISVSPAAATESQPGPLSQPNTVGWDDTSPQPAPAEQTPPQIKRFMLSSNVDNREEIARMIAYLGGELCEGAELDESATHLLCAAPGRSEKMLGSVAGGRWVLHPAYIARSRQHGRFLEEEEFEWGNPRATCLPALSGAELSLARAAHRWRSARAHGLPGPFVDVVALLHVVPTRRRLLARLVHAGGGTAPDDEPPYNNEEVTVCFADVKRHPLSPRDAAWLVSRRVPVCPPVLLSAYLTDETRPDPAQHCLPEFRSK